MIFLIFTLLVALLVAVFAVQNADPVAINLLWYVAEVPLVLVILGSAFAGALIVFFMAIWREFRLKGKVKAQAKADAHTKALEAKEAKEAKEALDTATPKEIASLESTATDSSASVTAASPDLKQDS